MDLYLKLENRELRNLHENFRDEVWLAFHEGEINNQDEFYDYLHQYIDNACIYTSDCESILLGNMEYCFDEHDLYGRPNNVAQSAFACLYDFITDHIDTPNWEQMEEKPILGLRPTNNLAEETLVQHLTNKNYDNE